MPVIGAQERYMDELVLLAQHEATYGQKPDPFNPRAILLKDVTPRWLDADSIERDTVRATFGANPSDNVNLRVGLDFTYDAWMLGAARLDAGEAPPHSALWRAAGLQEVVTPPSATIPASPPTAVNGPAGSFTYTAGDPFQGILDRTVTLECTTAGGSGVAAFRVSAPATRHLAAVEATNVVMTDGDPFPLIEGATIVPTVGADFAVGDTFEIALRAPGVTYTPVTRGQDSVYAQAFLSEDLHVVPGAKTQLGLNLRANNYLDLPMSLLGLFGGVTGQAPPAADFSAFLDPDPVTYANTPWAAIDGQEVVLDSLQVDPLTGEVAKAEKVNLRKVRHSARSATGSLTIQSPSVAERNFWDEVAKSQARLPLEVIHGTERGRVFILEAPRAELRGPSESAGDDGVANLQMDLRLLPVGGDDEFKIHLR